MLSHQITADDGTKNFFTTLQRGAGSVSGKAQGVRLSDDACDALHRVPIPASANLQPVNHEHVLRTGGDESYDFNHFKLGRSENYHFCLDGRDEDDSETRQRVAAPAHLREGTTTDATS